MNIYALFAGGLMVCSQSIYILNVLFGNGRPVQSSWLVWTLASCSMFASMYQANVVNTQIAVSATGTLIIFLLSLRYGNPEGWSKTDYVCLVCSLVGLTLWFVLDNPYIALGANILTMLISCGPTFASVYAHPERESWISWALVVAASLAAIASLEVYSLPTLAQPISYMIGPTVILFLIYRDRNNEKPRT